MSHSELKSHQQWHQSGTVGKVYGACGSRFDKTAETPGGSRTFRKSRNEPWPMLLATTLRALISFPQEDVITVTKLQLHKNSSHQETMLCAPRVSGEVWYSSLASAVRWMMSVHTFSKSQNALTARRSFGGPAVLLYVRRVCGWNNIRTFGIDRPVAS